MEIRIEGTMGKSIETVAESGVISDPAFCLGPSIDKTNSGGFSAYVKIIF